MDKHLSLRPTSCENMTQIQCLAFELSGQTDKQMWLQYSYKDDNHFVLLLCKVMKPNGTIFVIIPGWLYFTITGFYYPPTHLIYSAPVMRGSVSEILFARFFAPGVDFFNVSNVSIIAFTYFFSSP